MPSYELDLVSAETDPGTPIFWQTVYALACLGVDMAEPVIAEPEPFGIPDPSLDEMVRNLKRSIALGTETQAMAVLPFKAREAGGRSMIFAEWAEDE